MHDSECGVLEGCSGGIKASGNELLAITHLHVSI